MKLLQIRLVGLGPFDDVTVSLRDANDEPRQMTVLFGGGGVGKTTVLSAIASTRPGHATVQVQPGASAPSGHAVADWSLGDDDPDRPHPLQVATPNVTVAEDEDDERLRRREQSLFDRRAVDAGGFVVLWQSAARWYSRGPVPLSSPSRTVLRQDVRASPQLDDASRADLARETKQALVFAGITSRLPDPDTGQLVTSLSVFDEALRDMLHRLLALVEMRYVGIDPVTLEPLFGSRHGLLPFDHLPTGVRHLVGFGVLTVRGLFAAYPGRDPRMTEGLVMIDEVAMHQEAVVQRGLPHALRGALPRVQWLLTTSSAEVTTGCEPSEVLALRRLPSSRRVELHEGPLATLH